MINSLKVYINIQYIAKTVLQRSLGTIFAEPSLDIGLRERLWRFGNSAKTAYLAVEKIS